MVDSAQGYSWIDDLRSPRAYPHDASAAQGVSRIDTHISHVFLTGDRAYKIRRPVSLSFLDFSEPEQRLADCIREVSLNRRLAADVYLGLAPLLADADGVHVGEISEDPASDPRVVEHAVVMRRLEAGRDLRSMIERGEAKAEHLDRTAARLAGFHAAHSLGCPAPFPADEWMQRATAPARANFDALAKAPAALAPPTQVETARELAARLVDARQADFETRRSQGRVVDGHGDLHCEHVWFEQTDAEPFMIDCLEFREDFRQIDAASDVAFLAMDLAYRGRRDLAERFLRRYARDTGDYHLFTVVDYYQSYRAFVRAKVAALVAEDSSLADAQRSHAVESVRQHLALGLGFLERPGAGNVVLVCGTIGTGKTTVAEALADQVGGVVLSSDRLRRDLRGDGQAAPLGGGYAGAGYSDDARGAVYDQLLVEAEHVLRSGRTAILDATYSRRSRRTAVAQWAMQQGRSCTLVEVTAPKGEVLARLASRAAAGNDASEAGPELYDAMQAEFEPTAEWPAADRVMINSAAPDWREAVARVAKGFDASGG